MITNNTKDILSKVSIFTIGVAVGIAATRKYFKTKYERIAQEDINSVTEKLLGDKPDAMDGDAPDMFYDTTPAMSCDDYERLIKDNGYECSVEDKEEEIVTKPKVISLEEFEDGENPTTTLYYWADGVVTNDRNKIIANADELIGLKNLDSFNNSRVDSVYIRNYEDEIDYEILRDRRRFSEIS